MKKKIMHGIIFTNIFLLTGCKFWSKKKPLVDKNSEVVVQDNEKANYVDQPDMINFDNVGCDYNVIESKSIFADDDDNNLVNLKDESSLNDSSENNAGNSLGDALILDQKIVENNRFNIENIEVAKKHIGTVHYAFDVYKTILKESQNELHQIISTINTMFELNPNLQIIIEGHACNSEGSERYNIELSNKRALMMQEYIINNTQVKHDNISVFGCGTSHLIVYGDRTQQSPNRRAEIFVI